MLRPILSSIFISFIASLAPTPLAQPVGVRTAPLTVTAAGHFTIPVEINGRGPYPFVVDTAASHAGISPALAAELALPVVDSSRAQMHAAGGSHRPQIHRIDALSASAFGPVSTVAVALPGKSGPEHAGILGMSPFAEGRLEFSPGDGKLSFGPSMGAPAGYAAIDARRALGTFLFVEVVIDGVRATALVDSGARRTLANPVLQKALGIAPGDPRLTPDEEVRGASAHRTPAMRAKVTGLQVGPITYQQPMIAFADLPVFTTLGLGDKPALILAADLLGKAKAFAVDYPRNELQIRQ